MLAHELYEAPGAIAALLDLAAIGIEDAVAKIGIGRDRALDQQHLVAAHAETAVGDASDGRGIEVDHLAHAVDDDKIVAEALHLGEAKRLQRSRPRKSERGSSPRFPNGMRMSPDWRASITAKPVTS